MYHHDVGGKAEAETPVTASMEDSSAPFAYGDEVLKPVHPPKGIPLVSHGLRYPDAIKKHVEETLTVRKVYLLISKSLSSQTNALQELEEALGDTLVGKRVGMKPHTFFSELIEILNDMRPLQPDCIVTVGAGSLTDAAKILAWASANDVHTTSQLENLTASNSSTNTDLRPPTLTQISVPTTLSGGEFTTFAGATHDTTKAKHLFTPPATNPAIVILDPALTTTTPPRIWLSTGVRAIDHSVETVVSLHSTPEADALAVAALKTLIPALLRCQSHPDDLTARFNAQMGAMQAIRASSRGVPMGASHAIGHQLGPLGVGHGETSCICLPAVCRFNALKGANVHRQDGLAAELMRIPDVAVLMGTGHTPTAPPPQLGDILARIVVELGMPRTLGDVGVRREAVDMDILAQNVMSDKWAETNAVPLVEKGLVMEVLEMLF